MGTYRMKTPEDEAFDELAKKQGMWGGGFQAKKAMAVDKCQGMNCQKSDVNPEHSLECEAEHAATIAGGYFVKTTPKRDRVLFPTMLRKMWSGGEVQAWLDENVNKEKNT